MSNNAEQLLKQAVKAIIEEAREESLPMAAPAETLDAKTKEQIAHYTLICHKPYLTRKEVAVYLSVSERSISEWSARPPELNPFPVSAAGGEPRFKREYVDEWAEREAQRRRLKLAS